MCGRNIHFGHKNIFILVKEGEWIARKHAKLYVRVQPNKKGQWEICMKRFLVRSWCTWRGVWVGESVIHRAGGEGDRLTSWARAEAAVHR